ncbi:MAG: MaoC/PaaZ C-terminal domain-containing protein [Woeseiaceae bacterium]
MSLSEAVLVRSFSQADFDQFARLSGDDNPIHTDPEYSARTHFGRTVAHGLLLCSVLRGLVDELLPGGTIAEQSVMFPAPTFAGEPMRFSAGIQRTEGTLTEVNLEVRRVADGEVTCQGSCEVTA